MKRVMLDWVSCAATKGEVPPYGLTILDKAPVDDADGVDGGRGRHVVGDRVSEGGRVLVVEHRVGVERFELQVAGCQLTLEERLGIVDDEVGGLLRAFGFERLRPRIPDQRVRRSPACALGAGLVEDHLDL
jgi:hypothetical protein